MLDKQEKKKELSKYSPAINSLDIEKKRLLAHPVPINTGSELQLEWNKQDNKSQGSQEISAVRHGEQPLLHLGSWSHFKLEREIYRVNSSEHTVSLI